MWAEMRTQPKAAVMDGSESWLGKGGGRRGGSRSHDKSESGEERAKLAAWKRRRRRMLLSRVWSSPSSSVYVCQNQAIRREGRVQWGLLEEGG